MESKTKNFGSNKMENELNTALTKILNILEMEQDKQYISNADLFDQLLTAFSSDLSSVLKPSGVAKDYVGVHLGPVYDQQDFKLLLKSFKNNQVLDAFYALRIIEDAKKKLSQLPNIQECLIDNPLESGCIVVGDLHGNFNDLLHIIQKYGSPGIDFKFVFNGDFVDRGNKQIEVLLTLLYAFLMRPDRVFVNRGNHEDISMNVRNWPKTNFFNTTRQTYGKYWNAIFNSAGELFSYFPLATIIHNRITERKYFVVHGGIGDQTDLDYIQHKLDRKKFKKVTFNNVHSEHEALEAKYVSDLLWSDPKSRENGHEPLDGCCFNTNRNLGCFFGPDVTCNFCERHNFAALIRSHQVRAKGYSEDHEKCITVFSASHYCEGHNFGAILKFTPDALYPKPHRYKTKVGDVSDDVYVKNENLIKRFKALIQQNEAELSTKFRVYDTDGNGWIKSDQWGEVLSQFLNGNIAKNHLMAVKSFLCECDADNDLVNYRTVFSQKIGDEKCGSFYDKNTMDVVESLFDVLDRNNDRRISVSDAKEALNVVSQRLGDSYLMHNAHEFIKLLGMGKDNFVDLDEFKRTFLKNEEITLSAKEL
ncbi:serine threonine- phosphatase with EF-hands 1 [Brachionus plicatilis]|uniref:Serine/threonine-protein phosphatase n=1 Tax=Brachionus plicatilis TaxID=10195 RepID=A0A3M7QSQ2_BRAPC|nr:serine threonine- phosphatase with EF-hands 1 [Brachionus plicatilis]